VPKLNTIACYRREAVSKFLPHDHPVSLISLNRSELAHMPRITNLGTLTAVHINPGSVSKAREKSFSIAVLFWQRF
jgi:hypothetical protein